MDWLLTCWNGKTLQLPQPLRWQLCYGLGSPCDSVQVTFPWSPGQEAALSDATRLRVVQEGETLFCGVVDECVCQWSHRGCTAEITGRGLQALLLDNQAPAADFSWASQADILARYVTPYGITLAQPASLPAVWRFSIASGMSCWKVLYQFARYHGGVCPRFTPAGQLLLSPLPGRETVSLDETAPVTRLTLRDKRYGVLSQVTVRDTTGWRPQTEVNEEFQRRGGVCSRVLLMPRSTGYQARRYHAQFQLDRSAAELRRVEVTVAIPFAARPGELLRLTRADWGANGLYRVVESVVTQDETGGQTRLTLSAPDAVL